MTPSDLPPEDHEAARLRARLSALDALRESGDLTAEEHSVARRLAIFGSPGDASASSTHSGKDDSSPLLTSAASGVTAPQGDHGSHRRRWIWFGGAAIAAAALVLSLVFTLAGGTSGNEGAQDVDLAFLTSNGHVKFLTSNGTQTPGPGVEPVAGLAYDREATLWLGEGSASERGFVTHGCTLWSYAPLTKVAHYDQVLTALRKAGHTSPTALSANLLCFPGTDAGGRLSMAWYPLDSGGNDSTPLRISVDGDGAPSAVPTDPSAETESVDRVPTWTRGEYFQKDEPEIMGATRVTLFQPDGSEQVVWPLSFGLNVRQVALSPDGKWVFARAGASGCGTCTFDLYKTPADGSGARPIIVARTVQSMAAPPPRDGSAAASDAPNDEPAAQDANAVAAGLTVFKATCQGCHPSGGSQAGVGPQLKGAGLTADRIRTQVRNGRGAMPGGLVSGADLESVVQYVRSIQ